MTLRHIVSLLLLALVGLASAAEDHFAFLQESTVAEPDELELEIAGTYHRGRDQFYSRLDTSLEIECGVNERLQVAVFLHYTSVSADDGTGTVQTDAELRGMSGEVKYQVSHPSQQLIGSALYVEAGLGSAESELEGKLILDTHLGDWALAYNAVYELELEFESDETEIDQVVENQFGISYGFEDDLALGLEARTSHVLPEEGSTRGALYLGPTVTAEVGHLDVALCAQWQLTALGSSAPHDALELQEHERFVARLTVTVEL